MGTVEISDSINCKTGILKLAEDRVVIDWSWPYDWQLSLWDCFRDFNDSKNGIFEGGNGIFQIVNCKRQEDPGQFLPEIHAKP